MDVQRFCVYVENKKKIKPCTWFLFDYNLLTVVLCHTGIGYELVCEITPYNTLFTI